MKKIAVGILAHVDSGKTTLSEALMYLSGNIKKLGRVDHKNAFLDTFSLERERGITIFSKQAILKYKDAEFTLLDTPGHVDFSAETERTLQILDYAILVVNGSSGVQSHTKTLWKLLKRYNVPCFVFVNKMDLSEKNSAALMDEIKLDLSERCVDFKDKNDEFYENIALCDESLLSEYENGEISETSIINAVKNRKVYPCMFGSALKLKGVEDFFETFYEYTRASDYENEFAGKVYKISEDKNQNRLTFMKITGGALKVKEILDSPKNTAKEKVNQIRIYSGEKFTTTDRAEAGTVCAVTGINFALPGDGVGKEKNTDAPMLEPVLTYKLELPEEIDAHTALEKMRILENEDPQLNVVWNARFSEIQIQLMGDIQLEVLKSIIKERFGFSVEFGQGNIIYKETIKAEVEGVGHFEPLRHYAEVHLILRPLKRDSGLVFKSECKEDLLDKNWQRLILTHLYEKTHIGVLTGSPITDMEIILASGKAHPKHTEGGDFRQATYRAVRQGLRKAQSVLLEPVYEFTLEVPSENVGRAMSDIQRMSGSFNSPEVRNEFSVLSGTAPVSEMRDYTREVIQYTHGKGKLNLSLKGYEPCHNEQEVIEKFSYNPDNDTENTCDSVFCSHGAGHIVKWDEVQNHMHLSSVLNTKKEPSPEEKKEKLFKFKSQKDIFAADKELMQIFEQTYGAIKKRKTQTRKSFKAKVGNEHSKYKNSSVSNYDGEEYLLVDGYNVIFAWDNLRKLSESSIDGARNTLINILCNYQGYKKCKLIVVFDAYRVKGNAREIEQINGIKVIYTKEAETADMYIEKASYKLAKNNKVRVVTSDSLEQLIILGNGALRVSSSSFLQEVEQAENEIREFLTEAET
jgi:small GTP-binding protein